MVGRLRGSTKDPNRRRILNPEGRRIDLGGPQYNNWIKNGYKVHRDETKLVIDKSFTGDRNATRPVGRPKGKAPAVPDSQRVKNPETGRLIKKGAVTFKNLTKKYLFDEEKKEFIITVLDPKQKLNNRITTLLKRSLKRLNGIKFNIIFSIEMTKTVSNNNELTEVIEIFPFPAKVQQVLHESDISAAVNFQNNDIQRRIDRFTVGGSGFAVKRIVSHRINIYQNQLIGAGGYIKLPAWINNKKATINIQNYDDDKC